MNRTDAIVWILVASGISDPSFLGKNTFVTHYRHQNWSLKWHVFILDQLIWWKLWQRYVDRLFKIERRIYSHSLQLLLYLIDLFFFFHWLHNLLVSFWTYCPTTHALSLFSLSILIYISNKYFCMKSEGRLNLFTLRNDEQRM